MPNSDTDQVSLDELRALAREFRPFNQGAASAALAISAAEKRDGEAEAAALAAWLAGWQSRYPARLTYPRLALYAGIQPLADIPDALAVTRARIAAIADGGAPVHGLSEKLDADLRLYEMGTDFPPEDPRSGPAQEESGAARAAAFGLMAIDDSTDILGLAAIAPGGEATAALIGALVYRGTAQEWADPAYVDAVEATMNQPAAAADALSLAAAVAGPDIAALIGALMAGRLAGVPVLLDGPLPLAAAALVALLVPGGADHVRWAQRDGSAVSDKLAGALGLEPLVPGSSTGEGDGAARAIQALRERLGRHLTF